MIDAHHKDLSVRLQCELLSVHRSSYYYKPCSASEEDLDLMLAIDKLHHQHPFYGSRKIAHRLSTDELPVNRKRVQRLMRLMGIEAIYPKQQTTKQNKRHAVYPYLLRNMAISHPNQVWSADITYIPMNMGFMYFVGIIDWFSRYLISWSLSNTLEAHFCVEALQNALVKSKPDICNTDQGTQFTGDQWISCLKEQDVSISMDGKGRAIDNIAIERFFRSFKYEEIYINPVDTVQDLRAAITSYINFYNHERPHQSLGYETPAQLYFGGNVTKH